MNVKVILLHSVTLKILAVALLVPAQVMADESPCGNSLHYLRSQYDTDQPTRKAFDRVYLGLTDLPAG